MTGDPLIIRLLTDPFPDLARAAARGWAAADAHRPLLGASSAALASVIAASGAARRQRQIQTGRGGRVVRILPPPEPDPDGADTLWRNLHDLVRPQRRLRPQRAPHVCFEYSWDVSGLQISVWVPASVPPGFVERAVESAWPAARTVCEPAADAPPPAGTSVGGELRLALPGWYPLRGDFAADPLRPLLGAAAPAVAGERTVVQVLARPAAGRSTAKLRRAASRLRASAKARGASGDPAATADVRAILDKAATPLWEVRLRYAVSSPRTGRRVRSALRGRAHAVAAAFAVFTGRNRLRRRKLHRASTAIAQRRFVGGDLLSCGELADVAHLPLDTVVPGMARAGARAVPPSPAIPREPSLGLVIGDADAGPARPIVLPILDARQHLHVVGATGSGKSTLLINIVLADAAAGRGCVVVDPKGDLIDDIVARLAPEQRERLVLLDPQRQANPPALNMLEPSPGVPNETIVDNLVAICARIFDPHWGPRIEDTMRMSCLTLLHRPGSTLADLPRLLTVPDEWRRYLGDEGPATDLRLFWALQEAQTINQRAQVTGPLLYKLRALLLRPAVRSVVTARGAGVDLTSVIDGGKLLLARLPKGTLGEDASRLIGSFVVAKTWQAALARAGRPAAARRDARLVVDECHNYLNLPRSFDEMLAEARAYGLPQVLAHQHLGQLPKPLFEALSANARNKVLFKLSPEDAHVMQRHTLPQLTQHDLANLGGYQVACRLIIDGEDQPAFTARTRPPAPVTEDA